MARITVEDCLENVDNRFNLVLIAAKRARQLAEGYQSELDVENDKNTVLASTFIYLASSMSVIQRPNSASRSLDVMVLIDCIGLLFKNRSRYFS